MKKQGFTLAEVLITLTIIGVVAVLTLPALMTNTNEQQAKTALAKMTNTFTNAAHMAQANLGFDFSDINSNDTTNISETVRSMYSILGNTAAIDMTVNTSVADSPNLTNPNAKEEILFKDGTSLIYDKTAIPKSNMLSDGAVDGLYVIFDTNGKKGPNKISNCRGIATGISAWNSDDDTNCAIKSNRVIKDRFMMKLRGGYVTPLGAASTWALTGETTLPELNKANSAS